MTALTSDQRQHYRNLLIQQRKGLLQDIQNDLNDTGSEQHLSLARQVHDRGEEAVVEILDSVNAEIVQHQLQELSEIGRALKQLNSEEYGTCKECGLQIDEKRLEANPTSIRCIDCQKEWEEFSQKKN